MLLYILVYQFLYILFIINVKKLNWWTTLTFNNNQAVEIQLDNTFTTSICKMCCFTKAGYQSPYQAFFPIECFSFQSLSMSFYRVPTLWFLPNPELFPLWSPLWNSFSAFNSCEWWLKLRFSSYFTSFGGLVEIRYFPMLS